MVHGNRRVCAAKMAGLKVAPFLVINMDKDQYDKLYKLIETSHNSKDSWIKDKWCELFESWH
ncbi:MAG: hypothetical protein ACLRJC_13490 [Emergencia timonensis]|uniref:hypothetical protein n=1 Tax=Emergencia timonensis TaxID=1776384 RepID=UPI0011DE1A0E